MSVEHNDLWRVESVCGPLSRRQTSGQQLLPAIAATADWRRDAHWLLKDVEPWWILSRSVTRERPWWVIVGDDDGRGRAGGG
jgi:hypothetical protein